jgi:hypothetical protein
LGETDSRAKSDEATAFSNPSNDALVIRTTVQRNSCAFNLSLCDR